MNLFLPDSGLLFWMLISFSVVFFVLAKFGFPVILKSINEREKYIQESLGAANEAQNALANIQEQGKEILAQAQTEQMQILKEGHLLKNKMIDDAKTQAQKEANKIIEDARAVILKEKACAIADIRKEVVSISISMAEKVLQKELDDKKEQSQFIERLLNEVNISQS